MTPPLTVSWHYGGIGWSCVGRDVPLEEFSSERLTVVATYPPARVGHLKHFAPCPKCEASGVRHHWIFIGWETPATTTNQKE